MCCLCLQGHLFKGVNSWSKDQSPLGCLDKQRALGKDMGWLSRWGRHCSMHDLIIWPKRVTVDRFRTDWDWVTVPVQCRCHMHGVTRLHVRDTINIACIAVFAKVEHKSYFKLLQGMDDIQYLTLAYEQWIVCILEKFTSCIHVLKWGWTVFDLNNVYLKLEYLSDFR